MSKGKGIKIRGTATYYEDDHSFEFVSQKQGKPQRANEHKYGAATTYTTTGASPKSVVSLQCSADAVDKRRELTEQFNEIMKQEFGAQPKDKVKIDGIVLKKDEGCTLKFNTKKCELSCNFTLSMLPEGSNDFKMKFYELIQNLSKCFAFNTTLIQKYVQSACLKNSSK